MLKFFTVPGAITKMNVWPAPNEPLLLLIEMEFVPFETIDDDAVEKSPAIVLPEVMVTLLTSLTYAGTVNFT